MGGWKVKGMQSGGELGDPLDPWPMLCWGEVNMTRQTCHQQRWHTAGSCASHVRRQNRRDRQSAASHHREVGNLLLHGCPKGDASRRVLPQHHKGASAMSLH